MLSYARGPEAEVLDLSLGELLRECATMDPRGLGVVSRRQGVRLTWVEFLDKVVRTAAGLQSLGLKPGDRIGVWSTNCAEWVYLQFGAAAAGVLKAAQNLMGVTHVWFQGLDNVVPVETARHLKEGGVHSMLAYTRSILIKWGGLTLLFAIVMAAAPGFWLRLIYSPEMIQYGYILRLYALLYVIVFLGGPLRAGLQALEFTIPIFWSYLAMTAFALAFAFPLARWLGISGSLLGLIGSQILFQSIVGVSLLRKSGDVARDRLPNHGLSL